MAFAAAKLAKLNTKLISSGEYVHPESTERNGPPPLSLKYSRPERELRAVGDRILDLVQEQYFRLSDFAVLCPTLDLCNRVIDELKRRDIPYLYHRDNGMNLLEERVKVMTIHSAKGIEFPVVFLAGAKEGILPGGRLVNINDPEELTLEIERERILFYVGMTRSAEILYIVSSTDRTSRFMNEIREFIRLEHDDDRKGDGDGRH